MGITHSKHRLLVFVVTYNAENSVTAVLTRIPCQIFEDPRYEVEILIIDDNSKDLTFEKCLQFQEVFTACPLTILKNPKNLGYGGNQKIGYRYAIDHGFTIVALLHGDGQYAPEKLPQLIEPFLLLDNSPAAVFGSRMLEKNAALGGGMPRHKYFGNKLLTYVQNYLVGLELSEWHSGYRLYSCLLLKNIPFELNSNGFDFDTDIIVQIKAAGYEIIELPIPTFYGNEISHVNVLQYAASILWTCLQFRLQKLNLFYDSKFDLSPENHRYKEKFSFESSHSAALAQVKQTDYCLLLGCGPAEIVRPFAAKCDKLATIDLCANRDLRALSAIHWQEDLNSVDFAEITAGQSFSKVLALDVIEHLRSPENFCDQVRNSASCSNAELIITTPNVAFLAVRLMLLIGFFNYDNRGILDRTHVRLFTYSSLCRLLMQSGFDILEIRGIPAPVPLALGNTRIANLLLKINSFLCRVLPEIFSFQIFLRAYPRPTLSRLLDSAKQYAQEESAKMSSSNLKN